MSPSQIIIIFFVLLAFGIIIFPLINRKQFKNLSWEQKICMLMKEVQRIVEEKYGVSLEAEVKLLGDFQQ